MDLFNTLIRNDIKDINTDEDYKTIVEEFTIVIDDLEKTVKRIEVKEGKIDVGQLQLPVPILKAKSKFRNFLPFKAPKVETVSPAERFDTILDKFKETSEKTKVAVQKEEAIIRSYAKFRFALLASITLLENLTETVRHKLIEKQKQLQSTEEGSQEHRKIQFEIHDIESNIFSLENLHDAFRTALQLGDATGTKMMATWQTKKALYQKGVQFFTVNESSFVMLGATVTQNISLSRSVSAFEALATSSNALNRRALEATHGSMVDKNSLIGLVNNTVSWKEESTRLIRDLRSKRLEEQNEIDTAVEQIHRIGGNLLLEHRKKELS